MARDQSPVADSSPALPASLGRHCLHRFAPFSRTLLPAQAVATIARRITQWLPEKKSEAVHAMAQAKAKRPVSLTTSSVLKNGISRPHRSQIRFNVAHLFVG